MQPGETLSEISGRYGVSVEELARINALPDPDVLAVGQRLLVPGLAGWVWPVPGGEILSGFGTPRGRRRHAGLDIRARAGQPVRAARAGRVIHSGAMSGYGKTVILDHDDGFSSLYGHNSELLVRTGQRVERGQAIARAGRSGNATTVHCHFEVRRGSVVLNPRGLLPPGS